MSADIPDVNPDELTCRELVELVTDYLEGAMPPAAAARFEQHLAECDACHEYLNQVRRTIATLGRITPEAIAPAEEARLRALFRTSRHPSA